MQESLLLGGSCTLRVPKYFDYEEYHEISDSNSELDFMAGPAFCGGACSVKVHSTADLNCFGPLNFEKQTSRLMLAVLSVTLVQASS